MAYLLRNILTKNYRNRTTIVEIIIGGWVVYFFSETQCTIEAADEFVSLDEAYCASDSISVSSADWSGWMDVDVSEVAAEGGAAAAARRLIRARRPSSRSNTPRRHQTISRWMSESVAFESYVSAHCPYIKHKQQNNELILQHTSNYRKQSRRYYLKPWISQSSPAFICTCPHHSNLSVLNTAWAS